CVIPHLAHHMQTHSHTHPHTRHTVSLFLNTPQPPRPTLFPYTTLFRSDTNGHMNNGRYLTLLDLGRLDLLLRIGAARPAMRKKRSEEHTSELQSRGHLVCRLLLEKKKHKHHGRPRGQRDPHTGQIFVCD